MKSKVFFLSPNLYPETIGGMEIYNSFLIPELKARLIESDLIPLTYNRTVNKDDIRLVRSFFVMRRWGLGQISLAIQLGVILFWHRHQTKSLVISYTSNAQYYARFIPQLCKRLHIEFILIIHGGGLGRWKNPRLMRRFFESAREIVAVSPDIRKHYESLVNKPILYIPPSLPFARYSLKKDAAVLADDRTNLIFVGSLKEIKGINTLVNAFLGMELEYVVKNKLLLCIVGDGPLRADIENRVNNSDKKDFIRITGKVAFEKVQYFYEHAAIYIIPSRFEGTSLSMLQAMFNSIPVIGSDVQGINNVITHMVNGLLFPFGKGEDLRRCIETLVGNTELRSELAGNALKLYNREFGFDRALDSYIRIILNQQGNDQTA